ncbi:MAG: hypothetical protein H0V63_03750 [Burkholderiaceae bacterium]|nr:hypothetical protein [Burkholderiaceae bacterium]
MSTKRSSLPFANPVGESLDLMKKMWGFAGLPGLPTPGSLTSMAARIPQLPSMLAPTLDVDELEKRITDLRAVEQWLELNATILRTTIQSLEVQRATIATLKGLGGAMLPSMFGNPGPASAPPPEVALGLAAMKAEETRDDAARLSSSTPLAPRQIGKQSNKRSSPSSATMAAPINPAAWWNTLQDQFARIAATAAPASVPKSITSPVPTKKTAKRRARKPGS